MNITKHGIHLVSGDSAAGTWLAAFGDDSRLLVHRDHLSSGPLCACNDLAEWNAMRLAYWKETCPESFEEFWGEPDARGSRLDLMGNLDRLRDAEAIYIWAGTNVEDQLFLAFAVNYVTKSDCDQDRVALLLLENPPGWRMPTCSVSAMLPAHLNSAPAPEPLSPDRLADLREAWSAITSDSPHGLMDYVDMNGDTQTHLVRTIGCILQRFPWEETGLPLFDGLLLSNTQAHGPNAARVVGETLFDIWTRGDSVGDGTLYTRLRQMASRQLPEPLVELSGAITSYRDTRVKLTAFGQAVIDGKASSYRTNPIHDWVAGVRVTSDAPEMWMWSEEGLSLTKTID